MRSLRRHSWWVALVLVAAGLITLVGTQAVAGGRRGIDEVFEPAGLVGVVPGQAARLNVSNVSEGSCRAKLELIDARGNVVGSKGATIAADASVSLRFEPTARVQVRPRVISIAQSCSKLEVSVETLEVRSGRTVVLLASTPIG